jgi:hypothetical protein
MQQAEAMPKLAIQNLHLGTLALRAFVLIEATTCLTRPAASA